jgi:tetratricopeptide (TPR) repeat protein
MTADVLSPNGQPGQWSDAARFLEQAVKAGLQDPPALLLLAQAYKHLGRTAEARQTLSRIAAPNADVLLQRGLLAFRDKEYGQAADDFASALERDPRSFPAAYNLFLAHLWANQLDRARESLATAQTLVPDEAQKRFLSVLHLLLYTLAGGQPSPDAAGAFAAMSDAEEQRLLDLLVGLGRFEVAYPLLSRLVAVRPQSSGVFRVFFGAVLVQAKQFMDRNQWEEAKILLAPVRRRVDQYRATLDPMLLLALYQMLGVCGAMLQDFEQAAVWFNLALEIGSKEAGRLANAQGVPQAAWLEQNLALVHEWLNRPQKAEVHWKRYVDHLEQHLTESKPPEHLAGLAFECLLRLADQAQKAERWNEALDFLQRAHRFRPTDYETLEKLFNLYTQLRRADEARKVLRRMREVRPNDPQVELFELDVREVRSVEEVEAILQDLRRVAQKFPGDLRVDERTKSTLSHLIPALEKFSEQYSAQMHKVVEQMRRLPSYQVNWPVVRDVMRDLEEQFTQLRRVAQKMQASATADDQRRDLQRLLAHCDRKIDQCSTLAR